MIKTRRSMYAAGFALAVCIVLLVGTTFAWFTDSISNKGNVIQAGNLKVDMLHVGAGAGGEDVSLKENPEHKIFDYDKWEPGYTAMETLKVVNKGDLALKYRLEAASYGAAAGAGGQKLADVIEVWLYEGDDIPERSGSFAEMVNAPGTQWHNAGTLSTLMASSDGITEGVVLPEGKKGQQEPSGADTITIALHMQEAAGNEYQALSLGDLTITLNATQYTYEEDGFGSNQYDADAHVVTVATEEEFEEAAKTEGTVILTEDIEVSESTSFADGSVLVLNGKTLEVNGGNGSIKTSPTGTLTVRGKGTINGSLYADKEGFSAGGTLIINGEDDFVVNSANESVGAVYGCSKSKVIINGGTYNINAESPAVNMVGAELVIKDAVINVKPGSVIDAFGISSSAGKNIITNVTVNAQYSRAAYFNNSNGSVIIRGGTFITDKISHTMPVNPTIQYSGTLDIQDASITRVGTGILYQTTPIPTQMKGLTHKNCTFIKAAGAIGEDIGFKKLVSN